jgi:hypothetical protein
MTRLGEKNKILLFVIVTVFSSVIVTRSFASYPTTVGVYPQQNSVKTGQTFTINVTVEDVSGLQGFDFCLKYPTAILNVSKIEEGPFMASFGSTFVAKLENEEDYQIYRGRVWLAVAICGDGFADGSGTLAKITFDAIAPGEGELDLFSVSPYLSTQIKLVTCGPEPIPHNVLDGYVTVSADANNPHDNPSDDPPDDPPEDPSHDLNEDGKIGVIDLAIVALAYGKLDGEPDYDPKADLDQNGIIDILDIAIVATDFGKIL